LGSPYQLSLMFFSIRAFLLYMQQHMFASLTDLLMTLSRLNLYLSVVAVCWDEFREVSRESSY